MPSTQYSPLGVRGSGGGGEPDCPLSVDSRHLDVDYQNGATPCDNEYRLETPCLTELENRNGNRVREIDGGREMA